ncbi:uncharacterized protein PAC_18799 [Phialocephala subalpina]|uniref:YCII-related domain-containing protein n=1 Tax=Phialocephala subalpina TaxID=576137 RepID=A0A1L7XV66_9HELO|nr:uncharacterized protein PAC_18799 [Phialocephala subalpina]
MPRFIIFVRATAVSESELKPDPELMEAMTGYNATMVEAGVLLSADGLLPSSRDSTRITFHDSVQPTVQRGPFPPSELISGFWIVKVKDLDEAVAWAVKCPFKEGGTTEVRRIAQAEDFGDAMSPELRKREEELRAQLEKTAESG